MSVLDKDEARSLYNRIAGRYDVLLTGFRLMGLARHRRLLVKQLNLKAGDTVVDLCCGTGENFAQLARAVGLTGRVVGVDLSAAMLAEARAKIERNGWKNIELVEADVESCSLPSGTDAVISTFGLEMIPAYDAIIRKIALGLAPDGRVGLLGLKHPESWPDWLVEFGIWLTRPFGVSRDYEDFTPWKSAGKYMVLNHYRELLFGAAYSCIATKPASAASGQHN